MAKQIRKNTTKTTFTIESMVSPNEKREVLFLRGVPASIKERFYKSADELGLKTSELFERMVNIVLNIKQ